MKTIASVAYEYLKKEEKASFDSIWKFVYQELKSSWKTRNPQILLKDLEEPKKSELYYLLTVDGRFIKVEDGEFSLVENFTYEEVKKIRMNAPAEVEDLEVE